MSNNESAASLPEVPWWQPVLLTAMAGGMGWGIRGQYGHETGAMIAGILVSLTLVLLFCPRASSFAVARAVALATVAMGFGGAETYGQTIGLTQNPSMIGNWSAFSWGMLGLSIKGGTWIGFAGVFLGMGLGGKRYRSWELLILMLLILAAYAWGVQLLNLPFDPAAKKLPTLYFSADWYWEPNAENLKPRYECWGGLAFALLAATLYSALIRRDGLAWRMACWGTLGGALGFPLGQCVQSAHAWHAALHPGSWWTQADPLINWWNMMETTFGLTMGAVLGLGLWLHRKRVAPYEPVLASEGHSVVAALLLTAHVALLACGDVLALPYAGDGYDLGLIMGIMPMVAIASTRWAPYAVAIFVTLFPIAAKTLQMLAYENTVIDPVMGWIIYLIFPSIIGIAAAIWFYRQALQGQNGQGFARRALLLATWMYFLLNFAVFRYPWPWTAWTARTPNALIFTVCAAGLTALCVLRAAREENETNP